MKFLIIVLMFAEGNLAMAQSMPGAYVVPASANNPVATTYVVTDIVATMNAGQLQSVSFTMPADLVGPQSNPMLLTNTSGAVPGGWQLSNSLVTVNCVTDSSNALAAACTFAYNATYLSNLAANEVLIQSYLAQTYASDPATLGQKKDAALRFGSDPEGVLYFNFPAAP